MQNVIYAATRYGYAVQVLDGSEVSFEYSAGNHQFASQATTEPRSPNAVNLRQLRRWARQTAGEIAKAKGIPAKRVEYDPDLESTLTEWDASR
ncbi:MAG: hypothetical protein ABSG53_29600 [Thermoguttaceae bacterium]